MDSTNGFKLSLNILDCDTDKTGKLLAVSSLEGSIIIYKKKENQTEKVLHIEAHKNAVWKVKWTCPKFGKILASCGFDCKIKIWMIEKESNLYKSRNIFTSEFINASVNSIDWISHDFGLVLAACTSASEIIFIQSVMNEKKNFTWEYSIHQTEEHEEPINSVVWAPPSKCSELVKNSFEAFLASGSCDNSICLWKFSVWDLHFANNNNAKNNFDFTLLKKISNAHQDWIRDLSWSNSCYRGFYLLASGSEDRSCKIWKIDLHHNKVLDHIILKFPSPVWKVSWNFIGNLLAVAFTFTKGTNGFKIYKENKEGIWEDVTLS